MIQRIQTIYYTLAILALAIPLAGLQIFSFANEASVRSVTLFGNQTEFAGGNVQELYLPKVPLFIGNVLLILLLLVVIFSFKTLKRQYRIARFTLIAYLAVMLGVCLAGYFISQWLLVSQMSMSVGVGFWFMLSGILFTWLGNRGVRGDIKLIDSLNRLR